MDTVAALRKYNRWRRGLDAWHEDAGPNPKDIGEQIDAAADELERLRDEKNQLREALALCWGLLPDGDYGADAVTVKRCLTKFDCWGTNETTTHSTIPADKPHLLRSCAERRMHMGGEQD